MGLIGKMMEDFAKAITACVKGGDAFAEKMKDLATALSGDVYSIIKVVVDEAIHIWHDRKELTTDCKTTSNDWNAGDYKGAGFAVGDIVGIIVGGLDEQVELKSS